jgi:Spy/CpxP family protein refolding chaperone
MKKVLITVLLVSTFAFTALAQRGPRGGGPDPTTALKNALNLTDAQVESIKALMETRRTRAQTINEEIGQRRQALDALLDAARPDPAAVGNAAIALRASENKMQAERDWFIAELKKLLTGEQQAALDKLMAAGAPIPGLGGPGGRGMRGSRVN